MRLSIRAKLTLVVGVPLLAAAGAITVLDYRISKAKEVAHIGDYLTELVAHEAAELDRDLSTTAQVSAEAAGVFELGLVRTEEDIYRLIQGLLERNERVFGSCVAFEPGAFEKGRSLFAPYMCRGQEGLRSMELGKDSYDYTRWDWYLLPKLLGRGVWTDPYYDKGAGNVLMCTYSAPFRREGRFAGVTTVDVALGRLQKRLRKIDIEGGYCAILSQNGRFISHPRKSLIMRETVFSLAEYYDLPKLGEVGREIIAGGQGVRRVSDFISGEPKLIVFAPITSCGWSFVAMLPEERVMAPVHAELRRNVGTMVAGSAVLCLVILVMAARMTRHISRLAGTVGELAQGNLDAEVPEIAARDEIGDFARAFRLMIKDLRAHVDALTRETAAREAVEGELRAARTIQTSLLPKVFPPFPNRSEFSLHAVNEPAKHVAGDFFDFFLLSETELVIVIADVSGKGVPAALLMAVTRTLLKNLTGSGLSPGETLARANDIIAEDNEQGMFVTLFLGHYDTTTGRLLYANGGHPPPYRLDPQGGVHVVGKGTGCVVGAFEGMPYGELEAQLDVGDMLVLFTDGVTEAQSSNRELYGEERLEALLATVAGKPPSEACERIIEVIGEYQQGSQFDDVTLLLLRRTT